MSAIFITDNGTEVERTKCEVYTRVMWYYRPVQSFNIWKKSEFYSRTYFCTDNANKNFNDNYSG